MTVDLDDLDWQIVAQLQENGRMSTNDIAARIARLSDRMVRDRTVRYRIERSVKSGAIHIGAVVNPEAIGFCRTSDIHILTRPDKLHENALKVSRHPQVASVSAGFGDAGLGNISIRINARTDRELREAVREAISSLDGVLRVNGVLVPNLVKDARDWRPEPEV